ncbi:MAG TPA: PAS domain S-box protein [Syntrophorhabdaceae bacterium]|nr:PAS domain S-box protein [Syntrophorhabdaceae bacterium]
MFNINKEIASVIVDNSGLGIIFIDKEGRINLWNSWMSHRTGLDLKDVMGMHIKDALKHFPDAFFETLNYVYKHSFPRVLSPVFHMSCMSRDIPQKQFIKILPVLDDLADIEGILILIEDITTHLEYEEEIEKKSKKLRLLEEKARLDEKEALDWLKEQLDFNNALTTHLGEGIIVFNRAGIITSTNPATENILGWNNFELFGIHVKNIISETSKALAVLEAGKAIKSEEELFRKKDGGYIPVSYVAFPIILNEKIKSVIITFLDISEKKAIENRLMEEYRKTKKVLGDLVNTLSYTAEIRDPYTAGHQKRVANLARTIAKEMGLTPEQIENIRMAGTIHDLGKIAIPAEILSTPRKLAPVEFELIKEHPKNGYNILKNIDYLKTVAEIVYEHHERLDGSGYPRGLKGDEIMIEARILAVADVVEAMASHRPYRPALGIEAALSEIEKNAGILYDEEVVKVCLKIFREKSFSLE